MEATFSKNENEEAQTLSLTLKLRYGATVFNNDAYNSFVQQVAGGRLAEAKPGYRLAPGTLQPQAPEVVGVENGVARLTARAQGTVTAAIDTGRVRSEIANRPLAEAHARLASLPGAAAYDLQAWPGWAGRTPWLGLRIGVTTGAAAPAAGAPAAGAAQAAGAARAPAPVAWSPPNAP